MTTFGNTDGDTQFWSTMEETFNLSDADDVDIYELYKIDNPTTEFLFKRYKYKTLKMDTEFIIREGYESIF